MNASATKRTRSLKSVENQQTDIFGNPFDFERLEANDDSGYEDEDDVDGDNNNFSRYKAIMTRANDLVWGSPFNEDNEDEDEELPNYFDERVYREALDRNRDGDLPNLYPAWSSRNFSPTLID